jgi:hypothetical protein
MMQNMDIYFETFQVDLIPTVSYGLGIPFCLVAVYTGTWQSSFLTLSSSTCISIPQRRYNKKCNTIRYHN